MFFFSPKLLASLASKFPSQPPTNLSHFPTNLIVNIIIVTNMTFLVQIQRG